MSLGIYSQLVESVFTMVSWLIPLLLLTGSFKLLFLSNLKGIEGERQVQKQLKKLALEAMHDVILPDGKGGLTQIDHIVLLSDEILVIETKNYNGLLFGNVSDSAWTHKVGRRTHRPQNPLRQNYLHIRAVQALNLDVPVSGLVIFTNNSKFPKGIPNGVIQLKDLKKHLGHHTFSEPGKTIKDAWKILEFNARTDKQSKKEHMAHIESKHGKDRRKYLAYGFLSVSVIWLLGNLLGGEPSVLSNEDHTSNTMPVSQSIKPVSNNNVAQSKPIKDYMAVQRDRYIEKRQNHVANTARCKVYKVKFKEVGLRHKSHATGAFMNDMTTIWNNAKQDNCAKNEKLNTSQKTISSITMNNGLATIGWTKDNPPDNPELEAARDKCNSWISKALISRSDYDVERRNQICKKYHALKNKS